MYLVTYRLNGDVRYEKFVSLGNDLLEKRAAWENATNYAAALGEMGATKYGKISDVRVDWCHEN